MLWIRRPHLRLSYLVVGRPGPGDTPTIGTRAARVGYPSQSRPRVGAGVMGGMPRALQDAPLGPAAGLRTLRLTGIGV